MTQLVRHARAFTLIEAISAMVILATVSGVLSSVVWAGVRALDEGAESAVLHNEASIAMERMVRELRSVPLDDADTPDIASIAADAITWDASTRSLALDGTDLVLTIDGDSGVLLRDVTSLSIQAYDASNTALSATLSGDATDPIRRLSLEVSATRGGMTATVRTRVFLRCMTLEGDS